jgi:hypothetical protein
MKWLIKSFAACLLLTGLAHAQQPPLVDAHSHYTAFDTPHFSHAQIVSKLDQAGVSHIVITSSPWHLARDLHAHAPQRIIPLLGVYDNFADKARWMHDRDWPSRVATDLTQGTWAGIGELLLFAQDAQSPEFAELVHDPVFTFAYTAACEQLQKEGMSFKLKAQLIAEDALRHAHTMMTDKDIPASVRADMAKSLVRWAGYEQKTGADGGAGANNMQVVINLG